MRKLLLAFAILLLIPAQAFGVLPSTTVWEVRPTNGSDLNGGCVDSATVVVDYSQQDAAEASFTDLVTADGTTTTITSVLGGFTANMVGNGLHIESGTNWEPSFYMITSFTSSNQITVDRSPTSAAGVAGVGKVGGAVKTFEAATTVDLTDLLTDGMIVWVKNEAWNEAVLLVDTAADGAPIIIEGYNTSRGDNPTGTNRPNNNRAGGAGDAFNLDGGSENHILKNLIASNAADDGFDTSDNGSSVINCRATGNGDVGFSTRWNAIINCESDSNTGDGIDSGTAGGVIFGSSIHDNGGIGIDAGAAARIMFCLIYDNVDDGIEMTDGDASLIINNTIDGNTGAAADGIELTTPNSTLVIYNNILSNNGRYGIAATDGDGIMADYNNFFGNATAARLNVPVGDNDSTADPTFTDAANDNFAIGTNLKALGVPNAGNGAWPLTDGYTDMGAAQRQESSSGGASAYTYVGD